MYIVHVLIHIKPDCIEEFKAATLENARHSLQEPGVMRFDALQQTDDPTRFALVEVYRSEQAAAEHKETDHYKRWRDEAEPLMAEPRSRILYRNVFPPGTAGW